MVSQQCLEGKELIIPRHRQQKNNQSLTDDRLLGYAIGHITSGLPRWMYVFLIFGAISLVLGIFAFWLLPDLPATARFLNERERAIALDRVAVNRQGVKNHQFKWYQVWQAARDPKTWLLFVMAIGAQVPNSALTSVWFILAILQFIKVCTELRDRSLTMTCLAIVHIYYCRVVRLRYPRNSISSNPWWCSQLPHSYYWWLHCYQIRWKIPLPECLHYCSQSDMHPGVCPVSRTFRFKQMGSIGCPLALLFPGIRI